MRTVLPILLLLTTGIPGVAQSLRVVNAASLSNVSIAPGSIITIFGDRLAASAAYASNVQTLGGVSVTIGGATASLFYVSPTQINAVANASTPAGTESLVVTSPGGNQTATVTVSASAPPGLFSLYGNGTRDGAILNAVTFLLGAFSTNTGNSSTFLALFATGVNTSTAPVVTIGGVPVQVTFYGAAPCCAGLQQINVMLPASLAGAGRVPVVLSSNGVASNAVEAVLLPPADQKAFPDDEDNKTRSRELATLAAIPGTSLVLTADEEDDVIRVVDVVAKKVTQVIVLQQGSKPQGIAVTSNGAVAVVAEAGTGKAAVVDLAHFTLTAEIATGAGASRVAIGGALAVVTNSQADSVTVIDWSAKTAKQTIAVGHSPEGVAVDATSLRAYVCNEDDGTISVINLATLATAAPLQLGASVRPEAIVLLPGGTMALITVPAAGPDGQVIELDLVKGTQTTLSANPSKSGGSSDLLVYNSKVYFANQTGGSVSVAPLTGTTLGTIATVKVDLGARALAIDAKDNLLVVSNEGTGTLVLVDLNSNQVVGRINAVQSEITGDNDQDDHSDRSGSANAPVVQTLSPNTGKLGVTLQLAVTGTNLTGATDVVFVDVTGQGSGNGKKGASDFTVTNVKAASDGKSLTATVAIAASATTGTRLVRVVAGKDSSSGSLTTANTFTVTK